MFKSIRPTGVIYDSPAQFSMAPSFNLDFKVEESHCYLLDPPRKSLLKPSSGWLKSNEPEEHLNIIADKLAFNQYLRILCFSYKDESLAKRIASRLSCSIRIEFVFDPESVDCFPEDFEETRVLYHISRLRKSEKYNLVIFRHYLEHFSLHSEIMCELSKLCLADSLIYLEVPSVEIFLKKSCPLFLWEQHTIFFTKYLLFRYLCNHGMLVEFLESYGDNIEPSLCAIVRPNQNRAEVTTVLGNPSHVFEDISFEKYLEQSVFQLREQVAKRIIAFGAGHNLDRFLQFTNSHDLVDVIADSSSCKVGKYLYGSNSPMVDCNEIEFTSDDCIILGIHDRAIPKTISMIRTKYRCNPFFFSIYSPKPVYV